MIRFTKLLLSLPVVLASKPTNFYRAFKVTRIFFFVIFSTSGLNTHSRMRTLWMCVSFDSRGVFVRLLGETQELNNRPVPSLQSEPFPVPASNSLAASTIPAVGPRTVDHGCTAKEEHDITGKHNQTRITAGQTTHPFSIIQPTNQPNYHIN